VGSEDLMARRLPAQSKNPESQPAAFVKKSGTQTVTVGNSAAITFDSEAFDVENVHDTGSNTERLTAPTPGLYLVFWFVSHTGGGTTDSVREIAPGVKAMTLRRDCEFDVAIPCQPRGAGEPAETGPKLHTDTSDLTNEQIAQAQSVSVRTEGTHLGHVYGKLNISSRSELSAALASAGGG